MLSKEQLEKIANPGAADIGGTQSPIVTEMAIGLLSLSEQLEAERQRADALQTERDEFRRRLKLERSILEDTEKQLAELKALPPVGYVGNSDLYALSTVDLGCIAPYNAFEGIPLFTAAKPAED